MRIKVGNLSEWIISEKKLSEQHVPVLLTEVYKYFIGIVMYFYLQSRSVTRVLDPPLSMDLDYRTIT